jgi:hypothetical protein
VHHSPISSKHAIRTGVKYQGTTYVSWCLGFAVARAVVLVLLLEWNRRAPAALIGPFWAAAELHR